MFLKHFKRHDVFSYDKLLIFQSIHSVTLGCKATIFNHEKLCDHRLQKIVKKPVSHPSVPSLWGGISISLVQWTAVKIWWKKPPTFVGMEPLVLLIRVATWPFVKLFSRNSMVWPVFGLFWKLYLSRPVSEKSEQKLP